MYIGGNLNSSQLKRFARQCGADLIGIADLALLEGIKTLPDNLLSGYKRAVSVAIRLAEGVIDTIIDSPTPIYQQHYQKVNALLDEIALRISQYLQNSGARALPIPASQLLDKTEWLSYISHKAVGIAAGLGWQGKSLLLVNPRYGPRIRLVTILTDADLEPDEPIRNRCGKCTSCTDACPAQAIKKRQYKKAIIKTEMKRCISNAASKKVYEEFTKLPFIEAPICGVCIQVCPWGKRKTRIKPQS